MMSKVDDIQNKHVEQYTCLFSESQGNTNTGPLKAHLKQTRLKENQKSQQKSIYSKRRQKSQQKSIHLKKRQKRHLRSAQQKGEKNADKPRQTKNTSKTSRKKSLQMTRLTYWRKG